MAGTIKTDTELLSQVQAGIKVNGNGEITPLIHKSIEDNIIASKLSIKDGGLVVQSLTGYSSLLTPTDNKHWVHKKYVDDSIGAIDFTPYLPKSLSDTFIFVGNGSNVATGVSVSGDITISNTGVTAIGAGKVTNSMLAGSIDLTSKVTGILPSANGGTGVNNGSFTNTLSGNFATTGAFNLTFAVPRSTTWTLPNTASETLAGLATAQSWTAKQTFTGSATEMASVSLLDGTYKAALGVTSSKLI